MPPKQKRDAGASNTPHHTGEPYGQDRERDIEDRKHHPADHTTPHPPHHPQMKESLPPRHTPHSHPHGDDIGPHTNQPGPVKPSKKITKTGSKP
ncbi:MAG: hypothetical protein LLF84_07360 [Methanoregulaceae archaeon]|nr:hypothetical protein [Methanoregulaceae archaeon]